MIIYFSGTGNSEYVASAIADRLNDETICANSYIKENKKGSFTSDNPWIFVFPIYISTISVTFADFIRSSSFSGEKMAYFVSTCASSDGISPTVCSEICEAKGLNYMGSMKVIMPQNYIALFKMTPKDEIKRLQSEALETSDIIAEAIKNKRTLNMDKQSRFECVSTLAVEKWYNKSFTKTKKFFCTDKCIGCGLCKNVCPLNNIEIVDKKPKWIGSCIHCMSCINRCPKEAIEYGKKTGPKPRYVCVKYTKQRDN